MIVTGAYSKAWPDYRAVWRWHFYAGLLCTPFILWLATTGAIYLFKPQIEAWIDRPYDRLSITGTPATVAAQVDAALAVLPGSTLHTYELPTSLTSAARVIVDHDGEVVRVYVHPQTLQILKTVREEDRLMRWVFRMHGELLIGNTGSYIVELAASWAIVMILTGLYLWWPRSRKRLGGVLYPRRHGGGRRFWRDLHAVTGLWVSAFALLLVLTGLPWAKFWGSYLKEVRQRTGSAVAQQAWTVGATPRRQLSVEAGVFDAHAAHRHHHDAQEHAPSATAGDYRAIDTIVASVQPLQLAAPVLISPPSKAGGNWTAKSDAQNRTLRVDLVLDAATGAIVSRKNFSDRHIIDRVVGVGIAVHEGQLFGWFNQLLGTLTAVGLILISISSVVLWWRRRAQGLLGAPDPGAQPRFALGLAAIVLVLAIYLPLFAASLLVVKLIEHLLLRRIPSVSRWLGLAQRRSAPTSPLGDISNARR